VSRLVRQACLLQKKIVHAKVVDASDSTFLFVGLHSVVQVREHPDGNACGFQVVNPKDCDLSNSKMSVLEPMGLAVLGYRKGDVVSADPTESGPEWRIDDITTTSQNHCLGCLYYDSAFGCGHVLRQFNPEECIKSGRPRARVF
jgi:transcription elongation GreA/GreB family factor